MAKKKQSDAEDGSFTVEFDAKTGRNLALIKAALGVSSRAEWVRQVVDKAVREVWPDVMERVENMNPEE